jgi:hypothetical protein
MTWKKGILLVAIGVCTMAAGGLWAQDRAITPADAAAIKQFDAAIAKYLALRQRLLGEVRGPVPESTSTQLNQASDALAAAIQRSRQKARPGDLFVAPVVPVIKRRVVDAVLSENLGPVLAGIDDEEAGPAKPTVHMRFPSAAPLATMPPSLLAVLPKLPASLEYRIVGNFLILRDVDAALIIDVMPAAIPR